MDGGRGAPWLRLPGEGAPARWKSLWAFHRLDRLRADARYRGLGGQADAQVGEFLEQGQARAGGQAKDMAAAAAVGADKMEVPARHVDRGRGGRETEADQGTVDVIEGMHDLLRFDHFGQRSIGRLLFGLAAHRDASKTPVDPRRKDARRAVGQRIERRLQLLEGLSGRDGSRSLR